MTEAALLGLAQSVLGQLTSPALNELLLLWNFKKDLQRLGKTIETITCFIYDAEQRHSKEHLVKSWLSRLREVLYEADDLFDAIAARALSKKAIGGSTFKKVVTLFLSKSNQLCFVIKTAHEIKAIRESLDGIKDDMSPFQFQYQKIEEKHPRSVLEREERHSYVDSKEVMGRDQEKEDIINLLLCEDHRQQNLEVISVIGFGGLGKTTLAQLVYNDPRVQTTFDLCLWTCINYLSDLESVLVKILNSKPHELHLDQLQRKLRETIQGNKYLLVMDDVWDENASNWSRLKTLLNCGKIGSKILLTTRKTKVAQCLDAIKPYYMLNVLSEESAWSLFVEMAFEDGKFDGDSELLSAGKQILHKCGYVPLAVSMIGRMLRYRKKDKEEWLSFLKKEFAGVVSDDSDDGNLIQVLKVSYNDLPLALKHCFAYCSVFPKDHEFYKDELVRIWIAQGFVEPHPKKSLEEIGEDYFFCMVDRCFFQEIEEYSWRFGVVDYRCKMHDLLHDLSIQVARSESNCFQAEDLRDMVEMSVLRHISVTCLPNSSSFYSNLSSQSKSLRTLRFIEANHIEINSLGLVLDTFRRLRTLVLSNMKFGTLPNSFGGLVHLRYLDLSHNSNLTALPNSICKLYHLQTLLLTDCKSLVKLPSNITKLLSLRHLFLEGCRKLDSMPLGFEALSKLVCLDRFIVHPNRGGLRCLGQLDQLCGMLKLELPMNGWTDCVEDAKKTNMASMCRLSGVSIVWKNEVEEGKLTGEEKKSVLEELQPHADLQYLQIIGYVSDKLPSWFSSLLNVKKLDLNSCTLEYLDVSVRSGYLLPRLKVLELQFIDKLRGWWRGATSPRDNSPTSSTVLTLPRVSKLNITECTSLVENMPLFVAVEHLTLDRVDVRLMNMLLGNPNAQRSSQCHDCNKLQVLELSEIEGLECLSEGSIKHLTALKRLEIVDCEKLSWVSRCGLACLISLEELSILDCGGVRLEDEDYDERPYAEVNIYKYGLQRLRRLEVPWQCNLVREGLQFLTSLEKLNITYYQEQQVEIDNEDSECCRAMSWLGLERLLQVTLSFEWMACCFPKWTLHLPCLLDLTLDDCGEMNVDDWVAQQTQSNSLVNLQIYSDEELFWVHEIPWKLLPSLRDLEIDGELSSIPDGIQQLTSLQRLQIGCYMLKEIPKWMINLTSLQHLSLRGCSPELEVRFERETGVDWHLISHIPTIEIDYFTEMSDSS